MGMTEKRFTWNNKEVMIDDNVTGNQLEVMDITEIDVLLDLLNGIDADLLNCRAENTKLKLILKDVVNDLKRMNTRGFAEHIEKIVNLDFKGDVE